MNRQLLFVSMILISGLGVGGPSALADGQWHVERVDTGLRTGEGNAIAIDAADNIHISYQADSGPEPDDPQVVKYAYFDGSWHIETLPGGESGDNVVFGNYLSIAVEFDGSPHIAYESWGSWIKHAYNDGAWQIETADSSGGSNPRIALDSVGEPRIAYCTGSSVKYASRNGSWSVETIDDSMGACPSLALDQTDTPHVAYGFGTDDLHYAHYNGESWDIELVDPGAYPDFFNSIAIDSNGKPHVTYQHVINDRLTYARRDPPWQTDTVSEDTRSTSLALDDSDAPHIAYDYDEHFLDDLSELRYAHYDGSWQVTTVDSGSFLALDCSIALDSRGNPHISYTDHWDAGCPIPSCVDLKHAWYSACLLSTSSQDFGAVVVGDWAESTFTITNGGDEPMSGEVSESCQYYSIVSGAGPYDLDPDESVAVTVRFEPGSAGQHDCSIDTGCTLCGDVSVTGIGASSACHVDPESLDYGLVLVGNYSDTTFVVANIGEATLTGSVTESCQSYSIISGGGPYSLEPEESVTITVRFEPGSAGWHSCAIDTGSDLCTDVSCTGAGVTGVPTVSKWGLIVMAVLALTVGTVSLGRRRRPAAT